MDGPRLTDQLCFALYSASNQIQRAYRPHLSKIGLTYPQYLLLMALWEGGPQRMSGLADMLHLGPNAITPLVDRLISRGLVERLHDPLDRRAVRVATTQAGQAIAEDAGRAQAAVVCQSRLSDAALTEMRTRLHALVHDLTCDDPVAVESPQPETTMV